jgi:hypothetical protein
VPVAEDVEPPRFLSGLMKTTGPGDVPVQAHLFEYTTSFALTPDYAYDFGAKGKTAIMPCQIMFCLKEKNAKKVNSHRWFFNAFCPLLQPNGASAAARSSFRALDMLNEPCCHGWQSAFCSTSVRCPATNRSTSYGRSLTARPTSAARAARLQRSRPKAGLSCSTRYVADLQSSSA